MIVEPIKKTPLQVYSLLRGLDRPFILSSGAPERPFTYVGAAPFLTVTTSYKNSKTTVSGVDGKAADLFTDPFSAMSHIVNKYKRPAHPDFPFSGGAVGYFSYDLKDQIEPTLQGSKKLSDSLNLPLANLGVYDTVYAYDHTKKQGFLISGGLKEERESYNEIKRRLDSGAQSAPATRLPTSTPHYGLLDYLKSNMTREEYLGRVEKALDYIAAGDIYQVNISQRLKFNWTGDALDLFTTLNEESPAPFSSLLEYNTFSVISNSPERLLRVSGDNVMTEPIKGTKARGGNPREDAEFAGALLSDPKERAEHLMIVDLERNDLGRICKPGTVKVDEFQKIETFSTLHHIVSTVSGALRPEINSLTALKTCFPGGSITGAPKIRAMEIINQLEPTERGVYTGSIGYIDFSGDLDVTVAIRTAVHTGNTVYLNVGGAVVADSNPAAEFLETMLKAEDFFRALEKAKQAS